ncbi:MAG: hypothetical protein ACREQ5_06085 [Candidatus Dormibacteria bacterium]
MSPIGGGLPPDIRAVVEKFLGMADENQYLVTLEFKATSEEAAAVMKLLDSMRKVTKGA